MPNPGLLLPPTEGRNCLGNLFGSNRFNSLTGGTVVGQTTGTGPPARSAPGVPAAMTLTTLLAGRSCDASCV